VTFKATTKDWTKRLLLGCGALRLANHFKSPGVVILAYHSVQDRPELYANSIGVTHATSVFESQMELIGCEYNPVELEKVLGFLRGERGLPRNAIAVTFDDGYRDNFEIVDPILRRFGIPASFYLIAGLIGTSEAPWFCRLRHAFAITGKDQWSDPVRGHRWNLSDPRSRSDALQTTFDIGSSMSADTCRATVRSIEQSLDVAPLEKDFMMTWDQVRKLEHSGHVVGSHTLTHPNVAHILDENIVRAEFVESKLHIEKELGVPVRHFSYPHPALNPQWTDQTVALSEAAGYESAVTTAPGPVRAGDDPLLLHRMMAPRQKDQFQWNLQRSFLGHRV